MLIDGFLSVEDGLERNRMPEQEKGLESRWFVIGDRYMTSPVSVVAAEKKGHGVRGNIRWIDNRLLFLLELVGCLLLSSRERSGEGRDGLIDKILLLVIVSRVILGLIIGYQGPNVTADCATKCRDALSRVTLF